ncbi:MAG: YYY membrane protein, partial [Parcubacteria group bacterium GW2011_GWF2_44_8]
QSAEAQNLIQQYQVRYVIVGGKEKEAYPSLDLAGLQSLGQVVFALGETQVIEIK